MKWSSIAIAAALLVSAGSARGYEALQGPTELRFWDKARAYSGYTLFAAAGKTYVIDMAGRLTHTWDKAGTNPHLLDDGSILDATKDDPSGFSGFQVVDWDGNVTWSYTEKRPGYSPHHDFVPIYNPKLEQRTVLFIANKSITQAEALAAGADPAKGPYDGAQLDTIVEVDTSGTVVWEWRFFDHGVQDIDPSKANHVGAGKAIKDYPGRIDLNMPGNPLRKDWLHCNSLDYNQALDQVVINSVHGEFYVIDHGGTFIAGDPAGSIAQAASPAGDFLYRFGDPARYGQGDPPSITENWTVATSGHKQIGGAHHISWIPEGLPGAGHFLLFNNGQLLFEHTAQSYVFEIDPYLDAGMSDTGSYVNPPEAGYTKLMPVKDNNDDKATKNVSNQIAWSFRAKNNVSFFSHIGGSAQRLPNGNTLVCSDTSGHFFEVAADGTLVWEYINPVTRDGPIAILPDSYPMTNSVFRAYRYAADHPAFTGKDMTPKGTITGAVEVPDGGAPGTGGGGGGGAQQNGGTCPPCPSVDSGGCNAGGNDAQTSLGALVASALALGFLAGKKSRRR
ncbi:MAG: aryl-sulfate sulfotransferase [Byssovorax sp.]